MAQGDAWRIGVAVEIPNYSFRFPTLWESTLSANYTSGTRLYITDTSPDFDKTLKVGDKIAVGVSSYSGSEGAVETKEIAAIDTATPPTYVDIDSALTYDYSSGDKVFAVAHNLAGGATLSGTELDFSGINNGVGHDGDWSQKIDASVTGDNHMYLTLGVAPLASQLYLFGMFYKASAVSGTCRMTFYDGVSWHFTSNISVQASFTEITKISTTNASPATTAAVSFQMTGTASVSNLYVDCFYLQHAKGSSGNANGYYEFAEVPDANSVGVNFVKGLQKKRRLISGVQKIHDPSGFGERSRKRVVKAKFSKVSQAFWDQLMIFLDWQDKGNLLNLSPFLDDLPPFLQGTAEISNMSKDMWDLSRRSFDFVFVEA